MAGRNTAALGVLLLLLLFLCRAMSASATDYTVGDSTGWTNGVDYATWLSGKTFAAGDTLTFNYIPGAHTVDQVSSSDYSSCSASNALSTDSNGQTKITLSKAQTYYFICGVAGHCSSGMKLAIPVSTASSTSPSSPSGTTPITKSSSNRIVSAPASMVVLAALAAALLELVLF